MFKKLIRKMFKDLIEEQLKIKAQEEYDTIEELTKTHCINIIRELFDKDAPSIEKTGYYYFDYENTVKEQLEQTVIESVTKNMLDEEDKRIRHYISNETFIDSVVKRILDKQIK
ncbi:MAG: hypothetical protein GY756_08765 [bacterium]|nr:hypothetical protein [bacterium]